MIEELLVVAPLTDLWRSLITGGVKSVASTPAADQLGSEPLDRQASGASG
jgi:hypothetical protein